MPAAASTSSFMNRGFLLGAMAVGIVMLFFFLFSAQQQNNELSAGASSCPACNCPSCDYKCPTCPACNCECNCAPGSSVGGGLAVVPESLKTLQTRYLDLLRDTLCGIAFQTTELKVVPGVDFKTEPFNYNERNQGKDWPYIGVTMIGVYRLDNIRTALADVVAKNVAGDFVECGVWRGGGSIFAAGYLKVNGITDRNVWVVDSFGGLPEARTGNDNNVWSRMTYLMVSQEKVEQNFKSFGLHGDNVKFVKGYFVDSLPHIEVKKIAVMRMDGDMYESTMDQLFNLYDKVSIGGWIIIDDWIIEVCQKAIKDFQSWHGITDTIVPIDESSVYWIKSKEVTLDMSKYTPLLTKKP